MVFGERFLGYQVMYKGKRTRHKQTHKGDHKGKSRASGTRSKDGYKRERLMKTEGRCVHEMLDIDRISSTNSVGIGNHAVLVVVTRVILVKKVSKR